MQWLKFDLIKRPFYDPRTGGILASIEGRQNRQNIDPFSGGGAVYPDVVKRKDKIIDWYEKDGTLLLNLDISITEAQEIVTKDKDMEYKASPKEKRKYNHKDFKAKILTEKQVEKMKKDFFGIREPIQGESGVTL